MSDLNVTIRKMTVSDAPQVACLERRAFSQPWPEAEFVKAAQADNYIYLIAEHENQIIGYAGCVIAADEADITNIAVDDGARRLGIGTKLLRSLTEMTAARGVASIFLEVRQSNGPAQNLYFKTGFKKIGIRKNFYQKPNEDAILMAKKLH